MECLSLIPAQMCAEKVLFLGAGARSNQRLQMIEALEGFPANVPAFVCHGRVTKQDYDTTVLPAIAQALEETEKVRLYYETAPDFAGVDTGAALEDAVVGVSHLLRWEKIAVVTDVEWIRHTMKLFGFLMPAQVRCFPGSEADDARRWIVA